MFKSVYCKAESEQPQDVCSLSSYKHTHKSPPHSHHLPPSLILSPSSSPSVPSRMRAQRYNLTASSRSRAKHRTATLASVLKCVCARAQRCVFVCKRACRAPCPLSFTRAHSCSLALSLSHSLTLSLSHSLTLALSFSHTRPRTNALAFALSLSPPRF